MAPRLKPLQKDEDIKSVPVSEPVLVELPAMGSINTEAEPGNQTSTEKAADIEGDAKHLTRQLEELQAARDAERQRAEKAERDATEARRLARQRETENETLLSERAVDERALVQNGLLAAQAERDAAKIELKRAFDAGDSEALATAQSKVSRAEARILHFENAAGELEASDERRKAAPPKREDAPDVQTTDVNTHIDRMQNLLPAEKNWLKAHPDAIIDSGRNQELAVAYNRAVRQGLHRGTPEYFAYLEDFMGYKSASRQIAEDDDDDGRSSTVAAPVSRDSTSSTTGKPNSSNFRMELTPEVRNMIKSMGITERQYVEQARRLAEDKKRNPERYAGSR